MVMKFHNFEIVYKIRYIFELSSALACRTESKESVCNTFIPLHYAVNTLVYKAAYELLVHLSIALLSLNMLTVNATLCVQSVVS